MGEFILFTHRDLIQSGEGDFEMSKSCFGLLNKSVLLTLVLVCMLCLMPVVSAEVLPVDQTNGSLSENVSVLQSLIGTSVQTTMLAFEPVTVSPPSVEPTLPIDLQLPDRSSRSPALTPHPDFINTRDIVTRYDAAYDSRRSMETSETVIQPQTPGSQANRHPMSSIGMGDSNVISHLGVADSYVFQWAVPSFMNVNFPSGVAVDSAGYVYVTDLKSHSVWKFTSTGTFVT